MARTIDDQTNQKYDPNIAQITTKQQLVDYLKNAASSVDNIASGLGNAVSGVYNKVAASTPESVPDNKNKPPTEGAGSVSATPTNAGTIVNQQSYTPVSPTDYSAYYESLRRSKIQGLQNAAQQQKNALAERKAGIDPRYNASKTQADDQGQISGSRLAQIMANRGYSTGNQAQNMLIQNAQTQGEVSNLEAQRQAEQDQVARDSQNIDTTLASDIAASNNDIDLQRLKSLIDEQNRVDALNYSRSRDTVSDNRYNQEYADTRGDVNYNREQDTFKNNVTLRQLNNQEVQQAFENSMSQANFDENKAKNAFDMQMAKLGYDKSVSDTAWNQQMQERQFNWETDTTNNPTLAKAKLDYETAMKTQPYEIKLIQSQVQQANDENSLNALKVQAQRMENQLSSINLKYAPQQAQQQINQAKAQIANIYNEISNRNKQLAINQQKVSNSKTKADDSKLTAKQKADLKAKAYSLAAAANMGETPSQDQVDNLYDYLVGGENPTTSTQQPQAYEPASQITDQATRQRWYNDNKTEIDKSMTSDQLTAFKTKFGLK